MKKKIALTFVIVAIVCCAVIFAACDRQEQKEQARNAEFTRIALQTVGIENESVDYAAVTQNGEDSFVVEIEINGIKYDVTIGADRTVQSVKINDRQVEKDQIPDAPFENNEYIGKEAARNIALADAGVKLGDVTQLEIDFDFDDGKYLYEVEFKVGTTKYEYDIEAKSGEIHKKEVNDKTEFEKAPEGVNFQGTDAAIAIAVENALKGLQNTTLTANDATIKKAKLDFEKGSYVYEVEFILDGVEYDYELNAVTGAIIKVKTDKKEQVDTTSTISQDEAIRIATAHAGVSSPAQIEAKLKVKHGVVVWDVEFKSDGYEYEYEINAKTCQILGYDKEIDD